MFINQRVVLERIIFLSSLPIFLRWFMLLSLCIMNFRGVREWFRLDRRRNFWALYQIKIEINPIAWKKSFCSVLQAVQENWLIPSGLCFEKLGSKNNFLDPFSVIEFRFNPNDMELSILAPITWGQAYFFKYA